MLSRRLTFRSKLLGITALPLALIGYLSFQDVQDARTTQQAAARQADELDRQDAVADLADAMGAERAVLFDPTSTDADLAARRTEVDDAMARLRSGELGFEAEPLAAADAAYGEALAARDRIGDAVAPVHEAIAARADEDLLDAIEGFSLLPQQVLAIADFEVGDRETLANLTTAVLLERAEEALALEGTALQQALAEGAPSQATLERLGALIGSSDEAIDVALDLGQPAVGQEISTYLQGQEWADYQATRDRFTRLLIGQHIRLEPGFLLDQRAAVAEEFESHVDDLQATMAADTESLDSQASRDLLLAIAIGLGVLVLLAAFLYLLARSIRRSLGRVENRATEIANNELPAIVHLMRTEGDLAEIPSIEEIPVETRDEIGRLSAAFNELHNTAVRLAGEQAASRAVVAHMFVNLGRRNQKLLMRILGSLDELEREESDPDRLAKLYEVDHLVTRMRRNAESLLILADADVARRFEGPVRISELLRSTMAEVEEFQRINLTIMEDIEIVGDAAADLAHLLSELTENAARFSPPSEPIEVIARYTRVGYIVAVIDSGMGLAEEEIAEVNARIAAAANSAETPSRNLGHFVVGKLAGKYGMAVEVFDRVPAGLTVRVRIPRSLIISQPPAGVIEQDGGAAPSPSPRRATEERSPRPEPAMAEVGARAQAVPADAVPVRTDVPLRTDATPETPAPPPLPVRGAVAAAVSAPPATGTASAPPATTSSPPVPRPIAVPPTDLDAVAAPPMPPSTLRRPPAATGTPAEADAAATAAVQTTADVQTTAGIRAPTTLATGTGGGGGGVDPVFGTRRRVAGANLPDQLGAAARPEPNVADLRRSADSVASNLGALQRGLRGQTTTSDEPDGEQG